jgi:hypothetical protein
MVSHVRIRILIFSGILIIQRKYLFIIFFLYSFLVGSAASFAVNCVATAATPDGDIAWPETGFGFHPDAGASYILSTLPAGIGIWLALTGSRLTGHSIV